MQRTQKITARILSEAEEAAKIVIDTANAEANENLKVAQEQADVLIKQATDEALLEAEEQKARRLSAVESELRRGFDCAPQYFGQCIRKKALISLKNKDVSEKISMLAHEFWKHHPTVKGK